MRGEDIRGVWDFEDEFDEDFALEAREIEMGLDTEAVWRGSGESTDGIMGHIWAKASVDVGASKLMKQNRCS